MAEKIYNLGNGCTFMATNEDTIAVIDAAEKDLISKAEENEDKKMERFYQRVKTDTEFRQKRVVSYVLAKKLK